MSTPTRWTSRTRIPGTVAGSSTGGCATTPRLRPTSTATCSRAGISQNFLARDKELASFTGYTIGLGASYEFSVPWAPKWIQKSTLNARLDHILIDYDNFRDATQTDPGNGILAGAEPLYRLNANVFQLFLSVWF